MRNVWIFQHTVHETNAITMAKDSGPIQQSSLDKLRLLDKTQIGFHLNPENSEKFSCVKYPYANFPRIYFYLDGVQECAIY